MWGNSSLFSNGNRIHVSTSSNPIDIKGRSSTWISSSSDYRAALAVFNLANIDHLLIMHFLSLLSLAAVATARVLSEYDAAAKDQRSNLTAFDTINYECMDKNHSCETTEPNWNKTNGSASLYFRVSSSA
jgi:hypothetical protein